MLRKHIKIALILLLFAVPFLIYGIYLNSTRVHLLSRGNYFFDLTRNRADIEQIALVFPNQKSIHIEKKDNFWRIKEANNYYTAFSKINALVALIRNTVIYRADNFHSKEEALFQNALKIISTDASGKIVDEATIAPLKEGNKYYYALRNNDGFIYQLAGNFDLSSHVMDWVQMPLFTFNINHVKRIKADNFEVYRRFENENFKDVQTSTEYTHLQKLLDNFWYLTADEIQQISQIDLSAFSKVNHFDITLFNGIIYQIDLYAQNQTYWITVKLNREGLINKTSLQQIKENSLLFDGWIFKINHDKGINLAEFIL